jgi:TPR repeat protein
LLNIYISLIDIEKIKKKQDKNSLFYLGKIYYHSNDQKSKEEGKDLILQSAKKGNIEAAYFMGTIYHVDEKIRKAKEFYEKAAKKDHADAQFSLGYLYENYYEELNVSLMDSVMWYRKAADLGQNQAIRRLKELEPNLEFMINSPEPQISTD